jgi:hypothetical protein
LGEDDSGESLLELREKSEDIRLADLTGADSMLEVGDGGEKEFRGRRKQREGREGARMR